MSKQRSFQSNLPSLNAKLKGLFEPFFQKDQLTHVAVICGSLRDPNLFFNFQQPVGNFVFDLASLTKVLVTSPLVCNSLSHSRSLLEQPMQAVWSVESPTLREELRSILVSSLIHHTSGLPAWRNFWIPRIHESFRQDSVDRKQRADLFFQRVNTWSKEQFKNSGYLYSDIGYLLLGCWLEQSYRSDLSQIFKHFCQNALGLDRNLLFFPASEPGLSSEFVPTAYCPLRKRRLIGEVHDENAFSLGGVCGHAGLFGSAQALTSFLLAYFRGKFGQLILSSSVIEKDVPLESTGASVMGWHRSSFSFAPKEPLIKHLGFTGTGIWILPKRQMYILILTNRVYSSRLGPWIQPLREDVCRLLAQHLDLLEAERR